MNPRKPTKVISKEPWANDPNKTVHYEFLWKKRTVTPGTIIKLKNDRTQYRFICYVHDIRLNSTWVELMSNKGYRAVRIEKISNVLVTSKRSRAKKNVD